MKDQEVKEEEGEADDDDGDHGEQGARRPYMRTDEWTDRLPPVSYRTSSPLGAAPPKKNILILVD